MTRRKQISLRRPLSHVLDEIGAVLATIPGLHVDRRELVTVSRDRGGALAPALAVPLTGVALAEALAERVDFVDVRKSIGPTVSSVLRDVLARGEYPGVPALPPRPAPPGTHGAPQWSIHTLEGLAATIDGLSQWTQMGSALALFWRCPKCQASIDEPCYTAKRHGKRVDGFHASRLNAALRSASNTLAHAWAPELRASPELAPTLRREIQRGCTLYPRLRALRRLRDPYPVQFGARS